jgi:hypothetical protein
MTEVAAREFLNKFKEDICNSGAYDPDHILNMDETYISRDSPKNHTIEDVGVQTVAIRSTGADKENYSLVLAVTITGEKLPASIIFKG